MILRKFKLSDAERISYLLGDKSVSCWTANIPHPYDKSDAEKWIKRTNSSNDRNPYAIELKNKIVGCVSYWRHSDDAVEIGYWVGKSFWGQGIATQALKKFLSFEDFPTVSTVVAKTMSGNIASERVLLKCGFEFDKECVIRKKGTEIKGQYFKK